jgi:hypothetical protein
MDAIEELQAQLVEAQYLAKTARTEPYRMLNQLVANVIQREIERLQEQQQ